MTKTAIQLLILAALIITPLTTFSEEQDDNIAFSIGALYGPNTRGGDAAAGIEAGMFMQRVFLGFSMFSISSGNGVEPPSGMFNYPTPHNSYVHHSTVIQDEFGMGISLGIKPVNKFNVYLHGSFVTAEGNSYDVKKSTATNSYYRHDSGSKRDIDTSVGFGASYYKYGTPLALSIQHDRIRGTVGTIAWAWSFYGIF
ncbi:hypothetical protein NFC81_04935 [Salinispirillum sp. LH 10-3-1]|uniref:Outer membrane protein beta-barrel domain-containing protein n=1 Tax=Salinispirillum sp. LH 10-3-1 TaxID=2952525 RepID=A0AB38YIA7_9GAMM